MKSALMIDFGGTIDTDGVHWFKMFCRAYREIFDNNIDTELLRGAYVFAERCISSEQLITPESTYYDTIRAKVERQTRYLRLNGVEITQEIGDKIVESCYSLVRDNIATVSKPELSAIAEVIPIALVTNFYGNMRSVLEEFELTPYIRFVVESAVEGIRKPNPELYRVAVNRLHISAGSVVMVGDSLDKDIAPAQAIGCYTLHLYNDPWESEDSVKADATISTLAGLSNYLLR